VINNYLTSLLVFTLSFFNQQAFSKYTSSLASSGQANGALTNTAFHALTQMSYDPPKARNLMRLLHAYHHMSYMNFGGKLTNPRSWEMLRDRNLLSPEECEYLNGKTSPLRPGSAKTPHVLGWAYQLVTREIKEGRLAPPLGNFFITEMMSLRGACGALIGSQENPMPFGYMFAVNFLLYTWAISVGLFFAGFLSVYGSVAYALVVYVFFNLRNIGIQLSEPFGYKERHLPVPAFLMRSYIDHRDLLGEGLSSMKAEGTAITDGSVPDLIAPLRAKYDMEWAANFKATSGTFKQMAIMQSRFGFEGITEEDRQKEEKLGGAPATSPPQPRVSSLLALGVSA
jgi:predicted membrane chloride channel (bestrophin family)